MMRSTKKDIYQNSASQAACDTSIARVTGCVHPREGYRSVASLLMPRSTGLRRSALFFARKLLYNPYRGGPIVLYVVVKNCGAIPSQLVVKRGVSSAHSYATVPSAPTKRPKKTKKGVRASHGLLASRRRATIECEAGRGYMTYV